VGVDGSVVLLTGEQHPHVPFKNAAGKTFKTPSGEDLAVPALIGQDGRPIQSADGTLVAMKVHILPDLTPILTTEGKPILVAPDIPDRLPLIGPSGAPIVGPGGQVLSVPIQRDEAGRPMLGLDGRPLRPAIRTDDQGRPLLGADGNPILATSDEYPEEDWLSYLKYPPYNAPFIAPFLLGGFLGLIIGGIIVSRMLLRR
jgi:hypothetical protein